jgi:hypothetical protein
VIVGGQRGGDKLPDIRQTVGIDAMLVTEMQIRWREDQEYRRSVSD